MRGQDEKALETLQSLRSTQPKTPGLDRTEGDALYDLNRLPAAEAAFARALAADPHDQASAQMRGLTLFRLGRIAEAIPLLEVNHTLRPQSKADPTYVLALCYMDAHRYDDARHAFALQFGVPADSPSAYLITARMLLRREYLEVSQQFAERALAMDAHLPRGHELLGEIALAQNQLDVAIRELEQERSLNPTQGAAYEHLGDAYTRSSRYLDAQRVLQQAVLLEPNATGPYILLGRALLRQGQPTGAANFLQKAEAMDPANYTTHSLLAQAYRSMGRSADAARELELTQRIQAKPTPERSAQ